MEKKEELCEQSNEQNLSQPMVVSIISKAVGYGTGFFVKENLIATNIHCIAGATSVLAKHLTSNTDYVVVGIAEFDPNNDLVILKVEGKGIPYPLADSDLVENGEIVQAIGCLKGKYVSAEGVFHSIWNDGQWLRTTAKTEDGYSGGPLLNSKRQVIGIHSGSGDPYSTAISLNILKKLLSQTQTIEHLAQWQEKKQIRAYKYLVKSKGKIKTKNYDGVISDLDKTIQLKPDHFIAYYNRGTSKKSLAESKFGEGDLVEAQQLMQSAIDDFTEVIRLCPDYTEAYNNRGLNKSHIDKSKSEEGEYSESQQLMQSAIDDFTQAIKICPDYAPAYNNQADAKLHLAKSKAESGNMEQSQELYKDAMTNINIAIEKHVHNPIEEDPDTAMFHHTRGEIKEAMGDLHGAKTDFEKAIKNIEYAQSSKVSDDLKRVKEAPTQQ